MKTLLIGLLLFLLLSCETKPKKYKYQIGSVILLKQDSILAVVLAQDAYLEGYDYKVSYRTKDGKIEYMGLDEQAILMLKNK
jgi:hypothetical protein